MKTIDIGIIIVYDEGEKINLSKKGEIV